MLKCPLPVHDVVVQYVHRASFKEFNFIIHSKVVFVSGSQKSGFLSLITIYGNPYIKKLSLLFGTDVFSRPNNPPLINLQSPFPSPPFPFSYNLWQFSEPLLCLYIIFNYPKHLFWTSFLWAQLYSLLSSCHKWWQHPKVLLPADNLSRGICTLAELLGFSPPPHTVLNAQNWAFHFAHWVSLWLQDCAPPGACLPFPSSVDWRQRCSFKEREGHIRTTYYSFL